MSVRNTGVSGATAIGGSLGPVGAVDGLGELHSSVGGSSAQSFFPGGQSPAIIEGVSRMTSDVLVTAAEKAAIPTAIAALNALKQFEVDLGPDPMQWPLTAQGAKLKLLGTLSLQLPILAKAEAAALTSTLSTQVDSWIATLQAAQAAP